MLATLAAVFPLPMAEAQGVVDATHRREHTAVNSLEDAFDANVAHRAGSLGSAAQQRLGVEQREVVEVEHAQVTEHDTRGAMGAQTIGQEQRSLVELAGAVVRAELEVERAEAGRSAHLACFVVAIDGQIERLRVVELRRACVAHRLLHRAELLQARALELGVVEHARVIERLLVALERCIQITELELRHAYCDQHGSDLTSIAILARERERDLCVFGSFLEAA